MTGPQLPCLIFHKTSQILLQGQSLAFSTSIYKNHTTPTATPTAADVVIWCSPATEHCPCEQSRCCEGEGEVWPMRLVPLSLEASAKGSREADVVLRSLLVQMPRCTKAACLGETGVFSHPDISPSTTAPCIPIWSQQDDSYWSYTKTYAIAVSKQAEPAPS